MIFYLTYSEAPSGIYSSQVVDAVKFLNQSYKANIKLVAFVSVRSYFLYKKNIKNQLPNSIVLPMYPKMINWRKNTFLLAMICLIYKPKAIIARSVLACKLALIIKDKEYCSKVAYDGRGAISAEWKEYRVVKDEKLLNAIDDFEKEVVLKSDFRMTVSNSLIGYWKKEFGYKIDKHVVIPCTLNSIFASNNFSELDIINARKKLNINQDDIVFIYSGSIAGWQSFDLLKEFISPILIGSKNHKLVFLSKLDSNISELKNLFPNQVICLHLEPNEVPYYLIAGDYGLLIREDSVTNQVASPLKYAEYLSCGLKVIISEKLGDYSKLTIQKKWGFLYSDSLQNLTKIPYTTKQIIQKESLQMFVKKSYVSQYSELLENLN
jgi:hypothetical protein